MATNLPFTLFEEQEPELLDMPQQEAIEPSALEDSLSSLGMLPDGSAVFGLNDGEVEEQPKKSEEDFYANLAEDLESATLSVLGLKLIDEIKDDLEARKEWERTINITLKYTGFKLEEFRQIPFVRACAAYDSTLAIALIRCFATARAELFPAEGPCKSKIVGEPTQKSEDEGERVKLFINHYLTDVDADYYPDSELLLMYTILFGCAFRKVYQDPILNRPLSRCIKPQDFIINPNTTSILSSNRMAQVMYLDRKEVKLRERSKEFLRSDLPVVNDEYDNESTIKKTLDTMEGLKAESTDNKNLFKYYEVHVDLTEEELKLSKTDKDLPKPYVITICETTKKIVSIKRNWKKGDKTYTRREYFIHYYYLRGFGIYSLGLAHLMGSNAIVLTDILRQQVDAETMKMFPGGLKTKGTKAENNEVAIGPGEFREIETGGLPIQQCVMNMPYSGASPTSISLRQEIVQQTGQLGSTMETGIPENGSNTPVGTTLAMLEVANKVQSSFLRSLHHSLGQELKLLFNLFGEYLTDEPYPFMVPGKEVAIMKADFNDRINIVPVSDPNVLTSTHRLIRAQALLQLAQSNPALHDEYEVYHRMYTAMNVENIDKILKRPPQEIAMDAITENMYAMTGKPLTVALWQDHDSHNIVHTKFAMEQQMQNPMAYSVMMEHIQFHKACSSLVQLHSQNQQEMQQFMQIPPKQLLNIPEIQNMISNMDAKQVLEQQKQMEEMQAAQPKPVDPNVVMMADIEQRREAAHLKDESDKLKVEFRDKEVNLKAETEAFKAQLKFKGDTEKTEAQRDMASAKHEVDLAIAEMRRPTEVKNEIP